MNMLGGRLGFALALFAYSLLGAAANVYVVPEGVDEGSALLSAQIGRVVPYTRCLIFRSESLEPTSNDSGYRLKLGALRVDQSQQRYSGYGVSVDSIALSASISFSLSDVSTNRLILNSQANVQESLPASVNGSNSLLGERTGENALNAIVSSLSQKIADDVEHAVEKMGTCEVSVTTQISGPTSNSPAPSIQTVFPSDVDPMVEKTSTSGPNASNTLQSVSAKHYKDKISGDTSKRLALVIGNANYENNRMLFNPEHDAELVAERLNAAGFVLVGGRALLNLNKHQMDDALALFGRELERRKGSIAFFYYAGHGMQINGSNFLAPVDANPSKLADLSRQAIEARNVLQEMEDAKTSLNIVVLDACRNNPFGALGARDAGSGLVQMMAPQGTIIAYATQPGNVAQDGPPGYNSPFADALGKALTIPNLDLFGTFNQVGLLVSKATKGAQQPWISSSPIEGQFCFMGCAISP